MAVLAHNVPDAEPPRTLDLPATVQANHLSLTANAVTPPCVEATMGPLSFPDWDLHPELEPPEGVEMAEMLRGPDGETRKHFSYFYL